MTNLYPDFWKHGRAFLILKIIFDLGRPLTVTELADLTGGDFHTISRHCSALAAMHLLTRQRTHSGWSLTSQGIYFISPQADPACSPAAAADQKLSTAYPQAAGNSPAKTAQKSPKSAHRPRHSAQTGLSITTTESNQTEVVVKEIPKSAPIPDDYHQNRAFFAEIGILPNPQTESLARNLSPALLRAEWQKLQDRDKPWPGLLINILANRPPPPHPHDCVCPACLERKAEFDRQQRQRYAKWNNV